MTSPRSAPERVLVVEDHEPLRRSLERTLADRFPEVRSCATRREAVALLTSYQPDLLLVDLVLPDGTGLDIARAARREIPGIRILAMSGTASEQAFEELRAEGVTHHLRKPLTTASLDRVLRDVIEGRSSSAPREGPVPPERSRGARVLDWLRGRFA